MTLSANIRIASRVRSLLQRALLIPALHLVGTPFRSVATTRLDPVDGPFVFVANHSSHLDAPAILAALPADLRERTAVAAAADYFYRRRWCGAAISLLLGAFAFPRTPEDGGGRLGLTRAGRLLAEGRHILLFPEGTRSTDGTLAEFRRGVAYLLAESGAAAVPIHIQGAHDLWPRGKRVPRRGPLTVRLGAPWRPRAGAEPTAIAEELRRRVALLAPSPTSHEWRGLALPARGVAARAA